jgi:uncharacterized protein (DUF952 family)
MDIILHITNRDDRDQARASGSFRADTLGTQGFIHCSTPQQVIRAANSLFQGQHDLVLLCIDSSKVAAGIEHENLEGGDELFPHLYGPLNLEAVVSVLDFEPQADGTFILPARVPVDA